MPKILGAPDPDRSGGTRIAIFARSAEHWDLRYSGASFVLSDLNGLRYIQRLLQHPGEEFHTLDLASEGEAPETPPNISEEPQLSVGRLGDAGELLDQQAKQQYRRRLAELKERLTELRERGEHQSAVEVESEIDFLSREILRAVGLGGRNRRAGSAAERARVNVTRAIKTAIQNIGERDSELASLLQNSIRTGLFACYLPKPQEKIDWRFSLQTDATLVEIADSGPFLPLPLGKFGDSSANLTSFAGRENERATLRQLLAQAKLGRGRVVMIAGPAGVGKTRLATELGLEAEKDGFLAFAGACYDREDTVPLLPFVEILETALARSPTPEAFRRNLGPDVSEVARVLPQLRRLFPEIADPVQVTAEQSRRMLFNALGGFLERTARAIPILLLLDDVHWADEGALALLSHIAATIASARVLIIATYRDSDLRQNRTLARTIDELTRAHSLEQITLGGLPHRAVARILAALSGRQPPGSFIDAIYSNTEGNPFFVEELYRNLAEQGKLVDKDGNFRVDTDLSTELPHSLRVVIGGRLARLAEETRRVMAVAAVLGRSFPFELLEAAAEKPLDTVLDAVEEAEQSGLLISSVQFGQARFQFSHELVRKTIEDTISEARRQRLHLRTAYAIERLFSDSLEEHQNDLAHHLWQAGNLAEPRKTATILAGSAMRSIAAGSFEDAVRSLRRGIEVLKRLPEGQARTKQELELTLSLCVALIATRGYGAADLEKPIEHMLDLCGRIDDPALSFSVQLQLWAFSSVRGDHNGRGREICSILSRNAELSGVPMLRMWAHLTTGFNQHHSGELEQARESLDAGMTLFDADAPASNASFANPGVLGLTYLSLTNCLLGYLDKAVSQSQEAIKLARLKQDFHGLTHSLFFAATVHSLRGEPQMVLKLADETVSIATEHRIPLLIGHGLVWRGNALIELGEITAGINELMKGIMTCTATGACLGMSYWTANLALAQMRAGHSEVAIDLLDHVPALFAPRGEHMFEAELYRLKGEALLSKSNPDRSGAEQAFLQAIAWSRHRGARLLELRASVTFAKLLDRERRFNEAKKALEAVFGWFREGLETRDLREAAELLQRIALRSPERARQ